MALALGFMKEMAGVLGDVSIMHIGKKAFIRKRPKKSKNPPTELALAKRAKFGLGGKIAGTISFKTSNPPPSDRTIFPVKSSMLS